MKYSCVIGGGHSGVAMLGGVVVREGAGDRGDPPVVCPPNLASAGVHMIGKDYLALSPKPPSSCILSLCWSPNNVTVETIDYK